MKRRRVLLALAACLAGAAGAHHAPSHPRREDLVGWPMPPFALLDHHGRPFTHERLRLRWTFLLFGATHGGGSCDDALAALAALHVRLAPTQLLGNTQVVFVSLDPERDSPRRLREYLSFFDARFVGATGAAQALGPLVHDLGLDAATGAGPHGRGTLLLVGPDAVVRAGYLPPFQVPRLVAAYVRTRRGLPP